MREHGPARCRPCVAVSRKHGNAHCAPGPSPRVRAFPARLGWAQPKRATDRGHAPAAADGRQCRRQEMLRLRVRAGPIALPVGARGGSTPCLGAASAESGQPYRQRRQPASCRAAAVSCTTAARSRTVVATASIHSPARGSALCPRREQAMAPRAQVHACNLTNFGGCVCVCAPLLGGDFCSVCNGTNSTGHHACVQEGDSGNQSLPRRCEHGCVPKECQHTHPRSLPPPGHGQHH